MRDDRLDNNGTQTQATPAIDGSHIKGRKALQASRIVSVKARRDMHGDTDLQVVEMSDNTMAADVLKLAKLDPPPKTQLSRSQQTNDQVQMIEPTADGMSADNLSAHKAVAAGVPAHREFFFLIQRRQQVTSPRQGVYRSVTAAEQRR